MMTTFENSFWGEKFNGFEVLHQNFKMGSSGTKEFGEFVKERSVAEEAYSKALLKLANKTSPYGHIGSFEPCWKFVQNSTEKVANIHVRVIQTMQEVAKMLRDYADIQKDKQKQLKDEFGSMSDTVQNINNLSSGVQKAKELYQQRTTEVDKCRKESTTIKEIEKSENKLKKSCEDYKGTIEKRETARKDYEKKMRLIAQKFQELEKDHLSSLLKVLSKYGDSLMTERSLLDQIIEEFKKNMSVLTVDSLVNQFISSKGTGTKIPEPIQFEEIALTSPPVEADAIASRHGEKKKTKRVKKKTKRKEKPPAANGNVQDGSPSVPEIELEVDAEGYRIPPPDTESLRSGVSKGSFSSDSDSDSDDDEPRKFKVTIKPKDSTPNNPSLSIDELKTLSANLTLSSPSSISKRLNSTQDDGFFSGSGNLARTSSNLSRSSNALFDLNPNSKESSPIPPARSRKLFPVSTSMDALGEAAVASANKTHTAQDNEKKLVTFGDLFDTPSNDVVSSTAQSPVPINKTTAAPILNEKPPKKSSQDIAPPPPLPVKMRSMSGNSQSSLGFSTDVTPTELPSPTKAISSQSSSSISIATQRPTKTSTSTSQIPALAPPSQTGGRRQAISKKERPLPQPPSRKPSQPETSDRLEQAPQSGSFFADLAEINFGASQTTDFFPSNAVDKRDDDQSTVVSSTISLDKDSSTTMKTPVPLPRGDLQASKPDALSSDPIVPSPEKVTPIAVAFIETINCQFKGADLSKCDVRITGDMAISFPASIIPLLTTDPSPPMLAFDIIGTNALEQIVPNLALVERCSQMAGGDTITFKFNMTALSAYLKKQAEQGRSASYYNIDVIKYHVRTNGQSSIPLQLGAFWKCDNSITDLKIDFKYNAAALPSNVPLTGISMVVPVSGGVTAMQSKPTATWSAEHMRALWKMPSMSYETGNNGVGSFRARFDVSTGPSVPALIGVQFAGEGAIISNLKFDLKSSSYKLSLVKRRFITGKYTVEP